MAQPSVQGRFLWEGLATADPSAAAGFYSRVVGWRAEAFPADASYTVFHAARGGVAGVSRPQAGHTGWRAFIGSDDVDGTVAAAERLGGKVASPAMDIPQVGRIATLADPQGAVFAILKPLPMEGATPRTGAPQAGEIAWHELSTSDPEAALKFYQTLFGWQLGSKMDMGPMGFYWIFSLGGVQLGGMYKPSHPTAGPAWLAYVEVPDVDKAVAAITRGGGRILNGPMDVPGGRIVQAADPTGAPFAVHMAKAAHTAVAPPKPAPKPTAPPPPTPPAKPAAKPPVPKPAAPAAMTAPPVKPAAPKPAAAAAPAAKPAAPKKAAPRKKKAARKAVKKTVRKAVRKAGRKKTAGKKKSAARAASMAAKSARGSRKDGNKKKDRKRSKKERKRAKKDRKKARRKK
jgi:predicted enzyme related to lactoylglutathione lyase